MPTTRTAAQLVANARNLADQAQPIGGTPPLLVENAEARERCNDSIANLWQMLSLSDGRTLLAVRTDIVAAGVAPTFPADFYKLLRLQLQEGDRFYTLRRLETEDADLYAVSDGSRPYYYELLGIHETPVVPTLYPDPGSGSRTYRLTYIPEPPTLATDVATIAFPMRWWRWVEHDLAVAMAIKEESDPGPLLLRRDEIGTLILAEATNLDQHGTKKVRDVRHRRMGDREYRDWLIHGRRRW